MHWLCTLVVLNCCYEASGTCADPCDKRGMREHDAYASNFVIVCVLSSVSCFKGDSDFPDPNVERSMSLRHPAKGEFHCLL